MNSKIVKTVDEHNIDRDANVMFAFDLDGSEYVSYSIERDEVQDNLFISKVIKNIDGTFNMLSIDDSMEKTKLNGIVMSLVEGAVHNPADKLEGASVTLSDGKIVKFKAVSFNKEQRIDVKKTYVTTVKKEVSRVAEKYYTVPVSVEQPKVVEDIFPTIEPVKEEVQVVTPQVVEPISQPVVTPVLETPVLATPTVEVPKVETPVEPTPVVSENVSPVEVINAPSVAPVLTQPAPVVVESITVPEAAINILQPEPVKVEPTVVVPTPVVVPPVAEPVVVQTPEVSQPLIFNASKETNLNAALGEVANSNTIPVENIQPIREFGVDEPVNNQPVVTSVVQPEVSPVVQSEISSTPKILTKKAGFANNKFFMVVAIAFFLASCVFLGYEVFNYFQLTK